MDALPQGTGTAQQAGPRTVRSAATSALATAGPAGMVIAAAATAVAHIRHRPSLTRPAADDEAQAAAHVRGGHGRARPRRIRLLRVAELTPVRETLEMTAAAQPDLRDVFLCHAWPDRRSKAKDLHDQLEAVGVKVWFSEKDLGLGVPMMRTIDRGLTNSLIGLVLVTPAMLEALPREGVADKELSALLRGNRLVPVMDEVTFEQLVKVSPLLASRSGLSTKENTWPEIIEQVADLVKVHRPAT